MIKAPLSALSYEEIVVIQWDQLTFVGIVMALAIAVAIVAVCTVNGCDAE